MGDSPGGKLGCYRAERRREKPAGRYPDPPGRSSQRGDHRRRSPWNRRGFVVDDIPTLDELERRYLEYIFNIASGCVYGEKGMTELLNLKRSTLYTKLKKHGIMLR